MSPMWRRGGLTWWQLLARVWREIWIDQVPGRCAELAYYFLFSVFPLLLFLTSLLGYLAGPASRLRHILFVYVGRFAPSPDVTALLASTLDRIIAGRGGGATLSLSLLAALWVASSGMLALGRTLNAAYGVEESRPWWWRRLMAAGLTVGCSALTVGALIALLYGHEIGEGLADALGVGPVFVAVWHLARWPLVLAFVLLAFEVVYNFAPDLGRGPRYWWTPGAVVGVGLWLAVSFGLRLYLTQVHGYATTYGSLGAVIVLLLWFYLTALALVVGGEVNSVISRQIAALPHRGGGGGGAGARGAGSSGARAGGARRGGRQIRRGRSRSARSG